MAVKFIVCQTKPEKQAPDGTCCTPLPALGLDPARYGYVMRRQPVADQATSGARQGSVRQPWPGAAGPSLDTHYRRAAARGPGSGGL